MTRAQRRAILARSPIGTTRLHKGVSLVRAWGGHVNASTPDGFIGGFGSFAEAMRAIDAQTQNAGELEPHACAYVVRYRSHRDPRTSIDARMYGRGRRVGRIR